MQIYIIGIGQCGTSIAFDVISRLTGFVKSKAVTSSPQGNGNKAASNELLERLNSDLRDPEQWQAKISSWIKRLINPTSPRKVFVTPKIAIIDGNPDNFVKDAFQRFRGNLAAKEDSENEHMRRQLVDLIQGTMVLGFDDWNSGCVNGIVGETITSAKLPKHQLRRYLRIDGAGKQTDANGNIAVQDGTSPPVRIYLVVSSAGGGTGSGGGVYLGQSDALVDRAPNSPLVLNAVVLPSVGSSVNNPRYALNAGRALARCVNVIAAKSTKDSDGRRNSSAVLFSNPDNEGDRQALQALNNYIAEFSIRLANFTFAGNVARIARDIDSRELTSFFTGKVSVLGMSYLSHGDWDKDNIEKQIVEKAFGSIYDNIGDDIEKPQGLSLEKTVNVDISSEHLDVLANTTSAIMVLGLPPNFHRTLNIENIGEHVRKSSKSKLPAGIRAFSYGSVKDLEFTVFLRYRHLDACPLARYFVGRYIDLELDTSDTEVLEIEYLENRADQDDDYAEVFDEVVRDLEEFGKLVNFDKYVLTNPRRKTIRRGSDSNIEDGENS